MLLARDTEVHSSEYDWDLSKWAPLVQEKELVQWLVKRPSDAEALRARPCNVAQINKLEELWRTNPDATLHDVADSDGNRDDSEPCTAFRAPLTPARTLTQPHTASQALAPLAHRPITAPLRPRAGNLNDSEPTAVQMRYEDAYQYQNIMGPLVKLEADYDKQMKEVQTQEGVTVRWDMGLNKKRIAYFTFAQKDTDMRLVTGDELLLRHAGDGGRAAWQCQGTVVRLTAAEEVGLELRSQANVPIDTHHGFSVGLASNHISPTSRLHLA